MSDYANKLSALAEQEQKLLEKKAKLIEKRKSEIADLIEKCGLLIASDETLAGAFFEIEQAIKSNNDRIKEWEKMGGKFLKTRKQNTLATQESTSSTSQA